MVIHVFFLQAYYLLVILLMKEDLSGQMCVCASVNTAVQSVSSLACVSPYKYVPLMLCTAASLLLGGQGVQRHWSHKGLQKPEESWAW